MDYTMDSRRSIYPSIAILLAAGLLLRLLLAYVILPDSYGRGDLFAYGYWAQILTNGGLGNVYDNEGVDYPPGYLYILWVIGKISQSVTAGASPEDSLHFTVSIIQATSIAFDVCAGLMLCLIARKWAAGSPNAERIALIAGAIYLFNPVTLYDSSIWGQTDAIGACVMLLAVVALTQWPSEVAAGVAVLGGLIKPQFGVVLIPLVGVVLLRRHLASVKDLPPNTLFTRAYWLRRNGPIRLLASTLVALAVFFILTVPVNLDAHSFFQRMAKTAGNYHFLSVNAFNPWALVGSGGTPGITFAAPETFADIATYPQNAWSDDSIPLLGAITGVEIGTCLLALGFILGVGRLFWRADRWSIVLVGAYLCMCFFMLPTRVHERYIFPVFAFTSLLAAFDRRWLWATIALATASFMNLHAIFAVADNESGKLIFLPLSGFLRTTPGMILSVILHTAVFLFAIWQLHPKAARSEAGHREADANEPLPIGAAVVGSHRD